MFAVCLSVDGPIKWVGTFSRNLFCGLRAEAEECRGESAPGFRDSNSGVLGGVGNGGFSYSSSVSGIGGLNSNSYSQYLNTGHSDYRASGLQLRCLSE